MSSPTGPGATDTDIDTIIGEGAVTILTQHFQTLMSFLEDIEGE